MKVRKSFVSNSSSSSFVLCAKVDDADHVKETVKQVYNQYKNTLEYYDEDDTVIIEGYKLPRNYSDIIENKIDKLRNGYKLLIYEYDYSEPIDPQSWFNLLKEEFNFNFEYIDLD